MFYSFLRHFSIKKKIKCYIFSNIQIWDLNISEKVSKIKNLKYVFLLF